MKSTRFASLCIIWGICLSCVSAQSRCSGRTYTRREIRELLDPNDSSKLLPPGQAYIDGVLCLMRQSGSRSGISVWDDFTQTHLDNAAAAHGTSFDPRLYQVWRLSCHGIVYSW
jgi:hypothetical protein